MTSSVTTLSIYAVLLLATLLTPYAAPAFAASPVRERRVDRALCALLLVGALALTLARHGAFPLAGIFILVPLMGLGSLSLLGGITAALLFATTIWWTTSLQFGPVPTAAAALLALAAGFLPRWKSATGERIRLLPVMVACMLIGLAIGLLTAPFESYDTIYLSWHHWGAYLAPVEAWRGGGIPYRDFPIQYGLGPTLVLMASCGQDCWRGMYGTAITANALYFATLVGCVVILTARSHNGLRWLALLAMFCATFLWTGFPSNFAGPAMTPSVAGLRFLPISALLLHILYAEQKKARRDWIGHVLWLASLFWSPEAAFFATLIWWPTLALRDAGSAGGWRAALIALTRGGLRGACALVLGMSVVALTLWIVSGRAITLSDFFAYVQHPPGPLPLNPTGTIWIALSAFAIGIVLLARQGPSDQARPLHACLLALLAAGTYFISRSHDNNILNLFPLLILVLLGIVTNLEPIDASARPFVRSLVHSMLVAMVAFVAMFDFTAWSEGASRAGLLNLGPNRLISRFTPKVDDRPALLPADAVAALRYAQSRQSGAVILFDGNFLMPRFQGPAWTSVNNPANFHPLPEPVIRHYIKRSADSFRRPGWLVVSNDNRRWVQSFRSAYAVREQKRFGSYQAYYLVPMANAF